MFSVCVFIFGKWNFIKEKSLDSSFQFHFRRALNGFCSFYLSVCRCPDCDKAKPVIEEALSKVSQPIVLLECPVEREEYKNNKDYVYRTHSLVKLESLPTLIRIGSTRATARLGESECSERELVEEIFNVD